MEVKIYMEVSIYDGFNMNDKKHNYMTICMVDCQPCLEWRAEADIYIYICVHHFPLEDGGRIQPTWCYKHTMTFKPKVFRQRSASSHARTRKTARLDQCIDMYSINPYILNRSLVLLMQQYSAEFKLSIIEHLHEPILGHIHWGLFWRPLQSFLTAPFVVAGSPEEKNTTTPHPFGGFRKVVAFHFFFLSGSFSWLNTSFWTFGST